MDHVSLFVVIGLPAAVLVAAVVYGVIVRRKPGVQPGEEQINRLVELVNKQLSRNDAPAPAPQPQVIVIPAAAPAPVPAPAPAPVAAAARIATNLAAGSLATPSLLPTAVAAPVQIQFGGETVWLYQGRNFNSLEEIAAFDVQSAQRDANLANIDHSPLPLTPEQAAELIRLGGDPAARSSWKNPSFGYISAVRLTTGLSAEDVNRRINDANGASNYNSFTPENWNR